MSMIVSGSCARVFSLLSHHGDLNSACVNRQADVQDQEEDKWQRTCFRGRTRVPERSHTNRFTRTCIHVSRWRVHTLAVEREKRGRGRIKMFSRTNSDVLIGPSDGHLTIKVKWRRGERVPDCPGEFRKHK